MFFDADIKADRLPPRTICLTYDDGPGIGTRELGYYLFKNQIRATFFAVGQHAEQDPDTVRDLRRWQHIVGNHTYTHAGLVDLVEGAGDPVDELCRADDVLRDCISEELIFFRPPYGSWRPKPQVDGGAPETLSPVAEALNRSSRLEHYVGPIKWEIVAEDWEFWKRGAAAEECAEAYLAEIERLGRGIVLMHDSSEEAESRPKNRAMEATKLMVPRLRELGFRFIALDEIPQVMSALRVTHQVTLRASSGRFLCCRRDRADALFADTEHERAAERFGVVELGEERIALRSSQGTYVTVDESENVRADALTLSEPARLILQHLDDRQVYLRTGSGAYIGIDGKDGGQAIMVAAPDRAEPFHLQRLFSRR